MSMTNFTGVLSILEASSKNHQPVKSPLAQYFPFQHNLFPLQPASTILLLIQIFSYIFPGGSLQKSR